MLSSELEGIADARDSIGDKGAIDDATESSL